MGGGGGVCKLDMVYTDVSSHVHVHVYTHVSLWVYMYHCGYTCITVGVLQLENIHREAFFMSGREGGREGGGEGGREEDLLMHLLCEFGYLFIFALSYFCVFFLYMIMNEFVVCCVRLGSQFCVCYVCYVHVLGFRKGTRPLHRYGCFFQSKVATVTSVVSCHWFGGVALEMSAIQYHVHAYLF